MSGLAAEPADGIAGDRIAVVRARWVRSMNVRSLALFSTCVSEDVEWMGPAGAAISGKAAVSDWIAQMLAAYRYDVTVDVQAMRWADDRRQVVESGRLTSKVTDAADQVSCHDVDYELTWKRAGGEHWQIARYRYRSR